jgi:hypothetical protein
VRSVRESQDVWSCLDDPYAVYARTTLANHGVTLLVFQATAGGDDGRPVIGRELIGNVNTVAEVTIVPEPGPLAAQRTLLIAASLFVGIKLLVSTSQIRMANA